LPCEGSSIERAAMTRGRLLAVAALAIAMPLAAMPLAAIPSIAWGAPSQNPADIKAGHWVLDPRHANVTARVQHMGISLFTMRFNTMTASFDYSPANPEAAHVEASVDPASLDAPSNDGKFAEEFLAASKFPRATFVSTSLHLISGGHGTMTGDLTWMGVTKPVTFDVNLIGTGHEPLPLLAGRQASGFEATTTIKRSDFGSTFLSDLVGDDVQLTIEAEFERK
jgi:polyisoprenoid-binding protein YceI